ncbi:MAG: hypothetical protein OEN22_10590 [Gammaproteobacteria bacterium]|nr:hypothetical protein [Gammaproteobacteria bacterium]
MPRGFRDGGMNSYDTAVSQINGLQGTVRAGLHESHDRAQMVQKIV